MSYSVYKHECPNGKIYIGITSRDVKRRWNNGNGYSHNLHFTNAIKKYGWENIKHEIIATNLTELEAYELEKKYIKEYDSNNREKGYNKSIGGEKSASGFHHTEEVKRSISEKMKGREAPQNRIDKMVASRIRGVKVFDLDGNLLATFNSIKEAETFTNVNNSNITSVCKGKYQQSKGFIFRYADDDSKVEKSRAKYKPIAMYSIEGELIRTFRGLNDAGRYLGIPSTHIGDCCKGKYKQSGGYVWKFI